ncbi:MAG: metallophosphoesterase family protein [Candidatus Bathyarchaeia archaeon]|jgi:predicted phosphodiesterase
MAKTPWAILTSDWHLRIGGNVWKNHPDLQGDVEFGIAQVQEYVKQYDPPTILLAGDILDIPKLDSQLVVLLNEFFDEYCDYRFILFIEGQHDMAKPTFIDAFCTRAIHVHDRIVNDNGIRIYGLNYCRPKYIEEAMAASKDADVLLTHQPWIDTMGEFGTVELPTKYPLVCSGDFHKNFVYKKGQTTLLSPGSLCMQRISEHPTHGVWLIYTDLTYEMLPLMSRRYYEYYIKTEEQLDTFLCDWGGLDARVPQEGVPDAVAKNMVRIVYNPLINDITAKLTDVINNEVYLFLTAGHIELAADTKQAVMLRHAGTNSINKMLEQLYADDSRLSDAKRLLHTQDKKQLEGAIEDICTRLWN